MKKVILFLAISMTSLVSQAQSNFLGTTTNPGTSGETTVLNASIDTLNLTMSGQYNKVMLIQARLTKTSGTIAGTVRLYGSLYGATGTWVAVSDTLTLTDVSVNQKAWSITEPAYKYYRILQSGGTTMAGTLSAKAWGIKPN